jgi:hypothetical protein
MCFKLRLREALRVRLLLLAPYGSIHYVGLRFLRIYQFKGVTCFDVSP